MEIENFKLHISWFFKCDMTSSESYFFRPSNGIFVTVNSCSPYALILNQTCMIYSKHDSNLEWLQGTGLLKGLSADYDFVKL
jgi:hypothetical protein